MQSNLYAAFWDVHRSHVRLGREMWRFAIGVFQSILGQERRSQLRTCPVCLGRKKVAMPPLVKIAGGYEIRWENQEQVACPTCIGKGFIREDP